jgi:hypothetical protein
LTYQHTVHFFGSTPVLIAERKKQRFAQTNRPRRHRRSETERTAGEAEGTAAGAERSAAEAERSAGEAEGTPSEAGRTPANVERSPAQPDAQLSKPNSRHIANALRRQVYERDGGRCAFVSADGRRCCARARLEFHHIKPFARGGEATFENIALMCRAHNALLAERDYGREFVKQRIADSAAPRPVRMQTQNPRSEAGERSNKFKARPAEPRVSNRTLALGLE